MEENLTCGVCNSEYDVYIAIPKVLQCGHTFCLPCVTILIKYTPICPNCQSGISVEGASISTNYAILGILNTYKCKETSKCDLESSVGFMKDKYLLVKNTFSKDRYRIESSLKVINKGLDKITELTACDGKETGEWETRKILIKLGEDFKIALDYCKFRKSITISLRRFESPGKYLTEIYQRLQKDEKIYGVHLIDGKVMYGKVSMYDDKLIFHCLTLREVPRNSSLIWFDELKKCTNYRNFHPFIQITCNKKHLTYTVNIQMFGKPLSSQFIKLCTGEGGPSYKGSSYKKGSDRFFYENVLNVESFIVNKCEMNKSSEYTHRGEEIASKILSDKNEMFIELRPSGSFDIYRTLITGTKDTDIIDGKVISPSNLYDLITYDNSSCLKITDCGIVLNVQKLSHPHPTISLPYVRGMP